jgi:hypothetical protein
MSTDDKKQMDEQAIEKYDTNLTLVGAEITNLHSSAVHLSCFDPDRMENHSLQPLIILSRKYLELLFTREIRKLKEMNK